MGWTYILLPPSHWSSKGGSISETPKSEAMYVSIIWAPRSTKGSVGKVTFAKDWNWLMFTQIILIHILPRKNSESLLQVAGDSSEDCLPLDVSSFIASVSPWKKRHQSTNHACSSQALLTNLLGGDAEDLAQNALWNTYGLFTPFKKNNYFTSSDPHHDMLGGGCQVRVVIENMMRRMENLRTLISGFLGLVILVRWALVTMFLSWTTQTGCRIHRTYVSLIGSGEGRHTTHLLKCVLLLSTSQTDWKQSSDVLSDISFWHSFWHIFWYIFWHSFWHIFWHSFWHIFWHSFWQIFWHSFWHIFWHSFWHIFLTCFLTYLLTFFLTYQNQNLTSTASQKKAALQTLYLPHTTQQK